MPNAYPNTRNYGAELKATPFGGRRRRRPNHPCNGGVCRGKHESIIARTGAANAQAGLANRHGRLE